MQSHRTTRATFAGLVLAAGTVGAWAQDKGDGDKSSRQPTVEGLLKEGWDIAGYASNFEGRTLILFKHKDRPFLTQCSVFYDVTRASRVIVNCYEVH